MTDSGKYYTGLITSAPQLTEIQRRDLIRLAQSGNKKARDRAVECNLALVYKIAQRYKSKTIDFGDILGAGVIGLAQAIDRFDLEKGTAFSTYAYPYVTKQVMRECLYERLITLPQQITDSLMVFQRVYDALEEEFRCEPTAEEIACRLRWQLDTVKSVLAAIAPIQSLQAENYHNSINKGIIEDIVSDLSVCLESDYEKTEYTETLDGALSKLPITHQKVLELHFGLRGEDSKTLKQIAKQLKTPIEKIEQIIEDGLKMMRCDGDLRAAA